MDILEHAASPAELPAGVAIGAHRELDGLAVTEVSYTPGFEMGFHSHPEAYFTLTLTGTYAERMEGTRRTCASGSVVFRPPREPHASLFPGPATRCLRVRISPRWLDRLAAAGSAPDHSTALPRARVHGLAARLLEEVRCGDDASRLGIEGLVLSLMAEVARAQAPHLQDTPPWLRRVLARVHEEFRETLTIVSLAEAEGRHPAHVARAFRQRQGITIAAYVRRLRLEHARHELMTSDLALEAIAGQAGFSDQSHFTRAFKRMTGWTPAVYRNRFGHR